MSKDIVVIGGGVAGIHAALSLARKYPQATVHLFERSGSLGGTFKGTPGRMGLGFHYFDLNTALFYLRHTIEFKRKHSQYFIDSGEAHQQGVYVVVKGSEHVSPSMVPPEQIEAVYAAIHEEYKRLVAEDSRNQVYGNPETFLKKLAPEEYPAHINPRIAAAVYRTRETLLDVMSYINFLENELSATQNIRVRLYTEVSAIQPGVAVLDEERLHASSDHFVVSATMQIPGRSPQEFHQGCGYVVNAAWQNAEGLADTLSPSHYADRQLGKWQKTISDNGIVRWQREGGEKRQNRLKVLVRFRLPEALLKVPSAFFCMGSHCMFSNNGDLGKGYPEGHLTVADVTNVSTSTDLELDQEAQRLLSGAATDEEKFQYVKRLFAGASHYLSGVAFSDDDIRAGLTSGELSLHFGIVQTWGASEELVTMDQVLHAPESSIHRRDDLRVDMDEPFFGMTRALALKGGSYGPPVGDAVLDAVSRQKKAAQALDSAIQGIVKLYQKQQVQCMTSGGELLKSRLFDIKEQLQAHVTLFKVVETVYQLVGRQSPSSSPQLSDEAPTWAAMVPDPSLFKPSFLKEAGIVPASSFFKNKAPNFFKLEYGQQAKLLIARIEELSQNIKEPSDVDFDFLTRLWKGYVRAHSKTDELLHPPFLGSSSSFFSSKGLMLAEVRLHDIIEFGRAWAAYYEATQPIINSCRGISTCISELNVVPAADSIGLPIPFIRATK